MGVWELIGPTRQVIMRGYSQMRYQIKANTVGVRVIYNNKIIHVILNAQWPIKSEKLCLARKYHTNGREKFIPKVGK